MSRIFVHVYILLLFLFTTVSQLYAEEVVFGGVGLQVVPTIDGNLVILNVLEGAPAAEKGMLPGDLIYQVGDFPLQGSEFGKVVSEHLWGPVGSNVVLFYRRPGVAGSGKAVIRRSSIDPRLTVTPAVNDGADSIGGAK